MSEKVLGFKEKDAEYEEEANAYPKKDGGFKYTGDFHIEETELIPVVSLEWLEKEIEVKEKTGWNLPITYCKIKGQAAIYGEGYEAALDWILKAAKKQAGEIEK